MDLKKFLNFEDRGVSPVIGVILMVAITVILAAVIATFVMNMGPPEDSAPTSQFEITGADTGSTDSTVEEVTFSLTGGEGVPANELVLQVGDKEVKWSDAGSSGTVQAGDSITIAEGDSASSGTFASDFAGKDVAVIWRSANTDK